MPALSKVNSSKCWMQKRRKSMMQSGQASWRSKMHSPANKRAGRSLAFPTFLSNSLRRVLLTVLGIIYLVSFLTITVGLAAIIYHDERAEWQERHREAAQAADQNLTLFLNQSRQMLVTMGELDDDDSQALA